MPISKVCRKNKRLSASQLGSSQFFSPYGGLPDKSLEVFMCKKCCLLIYVVTFNNEYLELLPEIGKMNRLRAILKVSILIKKITKQIIGLASSKLRKINCWYNLVIIQCNTGIINFLILYNNRDVQFMGCQNLSSSYKATLYLLGWKQATEIHQYLQIGP